MTRWQRAARTGTWAALGLVLTVPGLAMAADPQPLDVMSQHFNLLESHQQFLERMYVIAAALSAFVVTLLLGLLTFFGLRTKRQVDEVVDRYFNERVNASVRKKVNELTEGLTADFEDRLREAAHSASDDIEGSSAAIHKLQSAVASLQRAVKELQERHELSDTEDIELLQPAPPQDGASQRDAAWQRIEQELNHPKYIWRSIGRLALTAGITPQEAEEMLRDRHPNDVVVSRGRSGRVLARLADRKP